MRIVIVTGIFPPDIGGPAGYVPAMAGHLVSRGHHVSVITLSDAPHDDSAYGFSVVRIPRKAFLPLRMARTFRAVLAAAQRSDVLFVNGLSQEAQLAASRAGVPAVHKIVGDYAWERARNHGHFHGTIDEYQAAFKGLRLRVMDRLRTMPLERAADIIVPSSYLGRIVEGWGLPPARIQVVYNAVPLVTATETPKLPPFAGQTLITVCRLVPWKGVDALLRSLAAFPHLRLVVAGDGPLRGALAGLARELGVENRVVWLGDVPKSSVDGYLRSADTFVLNSSYEGLPHVVLEAMRAGTPVVATRVGGTGEVIEDGISGRLIEPGNDEALRAALSGVLSNARLRQSMAEAARRALVKRFSFGNMADRTESILLAAAGRRGREDAPVSIGGTMVLKGGTRG